MSNIAISAFQGKMGQALCAAIWERDDLTLSAITHHSDLDWEIEGVVPTTAERLTDCFDVLIDFSTPTSTQQHLDACVRLKKPIVIGTTGLLEEDFNAFEQAAQSIPVFWASNMSIGVNVLSQLVFEAAKHLKDFDVEIFEAHHRQKKDAPSGTALTLGEQVAKARGQTLETVSVHPREQKRNAAAEIGFSSMRAGTLPGEHSVLLAGENETLTLTHRAYDRQIFASGAIKVANWIKGMPPGRYAMADFLKAQG